jgi:Fe-S-cluster containining protein
MSEDHWQELTRDLATQQTFMDMFTRSWIDSYQEQGGRIYCAKGCSACCTLTVNCTLAEAVAIAGVLSEAQAERVSQYVARLIDKVEHLTDLKEYLRVHRRDMGGCPLLDEAGACGVYATRPFSCRALLSTRESYWCGADFSSLSDDEKKEFIEGLDLGVTAFPMHYVASTQEAGQDLEKGGEKRMKERFGFSLYGNMPVLVDLVRNHGLADACSSGHEAALRIIEATGTGHPLLLDVRLA